VPKVGNRESFAVLGLTQSDGYSGEGDATALDEPRG
jgi:hypothetical protein